MVAIYGCRTSEEPTVEQLIEAADARAQDGDELAPLDAVIAVSENVSAHADAAVDQVVRMVRAAGHSWTVIGERLGISRQAARQGYADRVEETPPTVGLIRGRDLDSALTVALEVAEADLLAEAGTEHPLLGLLTDGVASATLVQPGVTREAGSAAHHQRRSSGSGRGHHAGTAAEERHHWSRASMAEHSGLPQIPGDRDDRRHLRSRTRQHDPRAQSQSLGRCRPTRPPIQLRPLVIRQQQRLQFGPR